MPLPRVGDPFPSVSLNGVSFGQRPPEAPTFLIVWRTECPTCRLALPFVERLHERYPKAKFIGIVQNRAEEIEEYTAANGLTFNNLADDNLSFSRSMDIDYVPNFALIDTDNIVLSTGIAWDAEKFEDINKRLAQMTGALATPLLSSKDQVPAFKPG
jgi:thiol-disulfide isomerase/thioredoxin